MTEQPAGGRGQPFQSVLRLEFVGDPARLVGTEQYPDDRGGVFTQPVTFVDGELLIGNPATEGGPSRYRVDYVGPNTFGGVWRTYQPAWLRARQPHTPEWTEGTFVARRRT